MPTKKMYYNRCGWCGEYEGMVDEGEICPASTEDNLHPHQFAVLEEVDLSFLKTAMRASYDIGQAMDALDHLNQELYDDYYMGG